MLYDIPPILSPDLLKVLREMGHGDEIVIVDGFYPATSHSTRRPPIELRGYGVLQVVEAILQVMPLDEMELPAVYMVENRDEEERAITTAFKNLVDQAIDHRGWSSDFDNPFDDAERAVPYDHGFYNRARRAFAIVATDDPIYYGCFILRKGVLPEAPMRAPLPDKVWLKHSDLRDFGRERGYTKQAIGLLWGNLARAADPSWTQGSLDVEYRGSRLSDPRDYVFERESFLEFLRDRSFATLEAMNMWGPMSQKLLNEWLDHLEAE